MYPKNTPLVNAAVIMTTHHTDKRVNNKLHRWLRKRASEAAKERKKKNGHSKGMVRKQHTSESNARRAKTCRYIMTEAKGVPVFIYNTDRTFHKEFKTITDCAKYLGTAPSNVKYTAEDRFGYCKGKMIRYQQHETIALYKKPKHPLIGRIRSPEHCANISRAKKGKTHKQKDNPE